ncbi:Rv1733c family protein [Streptomyces sp. enrichment culture]|uniref:Rv1733c family protein n=1 Tax=Streptomyces sp. enrichment culture TaxID=1795815 RepID=UPI003F579747
MRAIGGLWRWRHNPLCRRTDLAEAWVALAALLLALVAAPVAGCLVGGAAQNALQRSVRAQHQARHPVQATVVRTLDPSPPAADPEISSGQDVRSRVLARWTAPDGTERSGPVPTRLKDPRPGDRFGMWTDGRGRVVARPLDTATATTHSVLAGFGAALVAAALVEGGRRLIVWRMVRRRYARWDRAWDKAGPDWGRTGTGN